MWFLLLPLPPFPYLMQLSFVDNQDPAHSCCQWNIWNIGCSVGEEGAGSVLVELLFLPISPKKAKAVCRAIQCVGSSSSHKNSTVLSQGWEFCIIWTQLQSHTPYWGKCKDNHNMRHEPHSFLCFSFASFLFWKKAFHNCSLYWGARIKLMRVFKNCYEQTAFILKHLYTLITLSFLRCSCCIKWQKTMIFCILNFEKTITSAL